jgi:hypothetical protein
MSRREWKETGGGIERIEWVVRASLCAKDGPIKKRKKLRRIEKTWKVGRSICKAEKAHDEHLVCA